MFRGNRKKSLYVFSLLFLLAFCGCVKQEAYLTYAPMETPAPSAHSATTEKPAITPSELSVSTVAGDIPATDNRGVSILSPETHFFKYYVSFSNLRIYAEEDHCYLDATCTNNYDVRLSGTCCIVFYDSEGRVCGKGTLHTAEDSDTLILAPGDTLVYAEIASETDISMYSFAISPESPFLPDE